MEILVLVLIIIASAVVGQFIGEALFEGDDLPLDVMTTEQTIRLECLKMSGGDIIQAQAQAGFVLAGTRLV